MLFGLIPQEEAFFELFKKPAHNMIGLPVSTTQTITMSVMRVGAIKRLSAVRWASPRKSCTPGFSRFLVPLIYYLIGIRFS
jgi:phosphate/sulfate permease